MTASPVRRLQDFYGLTDRQQGGSTAFLGFPTNNLVGDYRLIGIHGHMLYRGLLLPTTSMVPADQPPRS